MSLPPILPFPDLVSPRVIGSRAVVNEMFSPQSARAQDVDNEYAGEEGNWRTFKLRLTSHMTGPRTAVLDKAPLEPEAALPKLPPLLARRRQRNRTRPWREAALQRELSYNQVSNLPAPARLPTLSQAQPCSPESRFTASCFRQPAPPDVLPPNEAYRLLLEDKVQARRLRIPEPVWMHGRAYRMNDAHREESVRAGDQQQAPVGPISSRWQGSRGGRRRDKRVLGANFVGG